MIDTELRTRMGWLWPRDGVAWRNCALSTCWNGQGFNIPAYDIHFFTDRLQFRLTDAMRNARQTYDVRFSSEVFEEREIIYEDVKKLAWAGPNDCAGALILNSGEIIVFAAMQTDPFSGGAGLDSIGSGLTLLRTQIKWWAKKNGQWGKVFGLHVGCSWTERGQIYSMLKIFLTKWAHIKELFPGSFHYPYRRMSWHPERTQIEFREALVTRWLSDGRPLDLSWSFVLQGVEQGRSFDTEGAYLLRSTSLDGESTRVVTDLAEIQSGRSEDASFSDTSDCADECGDPELEADEEPLLRPNCSVDGTSSVGKDKDVLHLSMTNEVDKERLLRPNCSVDGTSSVGRDKDVLHLPMTDEVDKERLLNTQPSSTSTGNPETPTPGSHEENNRPGFNSEGNWIWISLKRTV